jgi:endonuclease G
MPLNNLFRFLYYSLKIVIVILFLTNCTSKSRQAQLRKQNSSQKSNIPIKDEKTFVEFSTNLAFYPTSTTNQIINHSYFTLSYSEKDELPEWVTYRVTPYNIKKNEDRTNDYRVDPSVISKSASPEDYGGSGYDMGHLAPARIMSLNATSISESFYMSNICPQAASFNRGIWKRLENKVRYWAALNDSIYIVTGPMLDSPIGNIGKNNVNVPRSFYKTLLRFKGSKTKGIAFLMPNKKSDASIYSYAISIDSLEALTGINFYKQLESNLQNKVESNKSIKEFLSKN